MSSAEIIAPAVTVPTIKPRRGLASIKTMFSTKRHTVAQIPSSSAPISEEGDSNAQVPTPLESPSASTDSAESSHSQASSSTLHKASSLFTPNQKKAQEKAAEKEKKEQVKQAIQLSTVDHRGAFLPPTPLEKGYKDHFKDNDEDYFDTIISTPPERVRTFLSAASTISPGMFSLPSSKIKRHTFTSFPTTNFSKASTTAVSAPTSPTPASVEQMAASSLSVSHQPPTVPPKDMYYTPKKQQQQIRNRAQISFLTGDGSDEDLTEALADSISSLFSSNPASPSSQEVPDLMADDDEHSSGSESPSSSTNVSPRHSTTSFQSSKMKKWQPEKLSLGGELAVSN
ncbi:hypothetical protein BG015_011711 [Linnemannia schmuckeri]|uniref:Uncharacterized protein n=1 Tax=Linnemannia schmuckeri TaxID=64567 RepID=A0A9P5RVP0_9FUNG|nr:hypothetical protein BG015_011711 [Linnemannia schmuckeri]